MFIDDVEVVCSNEINIVEELTNTNTCVLKNCYPLSWEQNKDYTQFYFPKDYSLFKLIYDYTDFNLITENGLNILTESGNKLNVGNASAIKFVGVVKRSSSVDLNPNHPHFADLQILDLKTFLSEGDVFNFVVEELTVEQFIIKAITEYSGYNFKVGNINLGKKGKQIIRNYNCDQKTLFDVLQYISQITGSIWKVKYNSDSTIQIDFYDLGDLPTGKNLEYTTQFCNDNSIVDISYKLNSNDYRNKQTLTTSQITATTTYSEDIAVTENMKLSNKVGRIVSAKFNGRNIEIASNLEKENGKTADLYYEFGSNVIEVNEYALFYNPDSVLSITYYPLVTGRINLYNLEEIERIGKQLDNTGIISRFENRNDACSLQELGIIGKTYLQFKGKTGITLQVKTLNNDIWELGEVVNFNFNELADNYLVTKKSTQIFQNNADLTNQIFYTYELKNNFNVENELNFFDNQRAKLIGNIQAGEYIDKYINYNDSIQIIFNEPVIGGA
jgi:hypothetical protein